MYELKISFFGPFALSLGESVLKEDSQCLRKQWRLIKYLVLNREREVERCELIDATFGYGSYSGEHEKGLNALNALIHRARRTLEKAGLPVFITHRAGKYTVILPENVRIDCEKFTALSRDIFSKSDLTVIREKALEAMYLYGGFFLNGNYFDEKTRLSAEKYHADYRRIFSLLCGILRSDGDFSLIASISRRATEVDPLCEDFYIEYINALILSGDVLGAKNAYLDACAFFESKTSVIVSSAFKELGQKLDRQGDAVILIPKEHADKADAVSDTVSKMLDGAKVKISLI